MTEPLLTIVTLTIPGREGPLAELSGEVARQSAGKPVRHLVLPGAGGYGRKMAVSLMLVDTEYVAWVDDDDMIYPGYVDRITTAVELYRPDVVTFGSRSPGCVPAWLRFGKEDRSESSPDGNVNSANHYCAWKADVARLVPWLPQNYAAEAVWYNALRLCYPNLKEFFIPEVLHEYRFDGARTECQNPRTCHLSLANGGNLVRILKMPDGSVALAKGRRQPVNGRYMVLTASWEFVPVLADSVVVVKEIDLR